MKSYKSPTNNGGTTIILDSQEQAIQLAKDAKDKFFNTKEFYRLDDTMVGNLKNNLDQACKDITTGNIEFQRDAEERIETLLGMVDDLVPSFSQSKQGYTREENGITTTADLILSGEEKCCFNRKSSEELEVKRGTGDGAYRILINTDVAWWGNADDNLYVIGALIVLMQRYAPVEVWIQQGWLGSSENDGVTLFKLNYESSIDLTNLHFWIASQYKDFPFSWAVNKSLGRNDTRTSIVSEIECDLMIRGDWFRTFDLTEYKLSTMLYTDKLDLMAKWIAYTGYKILHDGDVPPEIKI